MDVLRLLIFILVVYLIYLLIVRGSISQAAGIIGGFLSGVRGPSAEDDADGDYEGGNYDGIYDGGKRKRKPDPSGHPVSSISITKHTFGDKEYEIDWMKLIESGDKKWEGRVNIGMWSRVKPGDTVILVQGDRRLPVVVEEIKPFKDFAEAYEALGTDLVPKVDKHKFTTDEVREIYAGFVRAPMENGVLAIKVKPEPEK